MVNKKNGIIAAVVAVVVIIIAIVLFFVFGHKSKEMFTVTFDSNGGTKVASVEVEKGSKVSIPSDPTKEGFTFTGWYLDNKKYDFDQKVEKDITLKAVWEEVKTPDKKPSTTTKPTTPVKPVVQESFTITFDSNGANKVASVTVVKGNRLQLPVPQKEGYEFLGWYLNGEKVTSETVVEEDMTLKALWKPIVKVVMEEVQTSKTGEAYLYVLVAGKRVETIADIETVAEGKVTKNVTIPATGLKINKGETSVDKVVVTRY